MALTGNNIELLVKLGVNSGESKANLNAQIDEIQKKLKEVKIDIKIDPQAIKSLNQLATMDFSKLVKSANDVKKAMDGMGGKGKKPLEEIVDEGRKLADVAPTINNAFKSVGGNLQKAMSKGITSIEELKVAFKGMDATFSYGKEIITSDQQMTAEKRINGITVAFKNAQGAIEKMKLSNKEFIDMGNGKLQPIYQPIGDSKVIDSSLKNVATSVANTKAQIEKLRIEGKITEEQFKKLNLQINSAARNSVNGKQAADNFREMSNEINRAVQATKNQTAAQKEQVANQKRLIDNENKRKNLIIDIERAIRTAGKGYDTEGATKLLRQTQALDVSNKKFGQTIAENRTALRRMSAEAASASRDSIGLINAFQQALTKFPIDINSQVGVKLFELLESP